MILSKLDHYVNSILESVIAIPQERKVLLNEVAKALLEKQIFNLVFICTHNSRRSHLAQIWATVASSFHGLSKYEMHSGGTEVTALNPRIINALSNVGFQVDGQEIENPRYLLRYSQVFPVITAFSKKFDHFVNPSQNFAALMTCSHADTHCPMIHGADTRFLLRYDDPKVSDDTDQEQIVYSQRSFEIAREMFYLMSLLAK